MTQMSDALAAAGVAVPTQIEQVWRAVKAQAGRSAAELHAQLKHLPHTTVSGLLVAMEQRDMVYSRVDATQERAVKRFYTDLTEYKRLPKPGGPGKGKRKNGKPSAPVAVPASKPAAPAPTDDQFVRYAENYNSVVAAWAKAGGDPSTILNLSVGQFLVAASRNKLTVRVSS